jgi:hypothetical protein
VNDNFRDVVQMMLGEGVIGEADCGGVWMSQIVSDARRVSFFAKFHWPGKHRFTARFG